MDTFEFSAHLEEMEREAGERISRYADEVKIAGAACEATWPIHAKSESKP